MQGCTQSDVINLMLRCVPHDEGRVVKCHAKTLLQVLLSPAAGLAFRLRGFSNWEQESVRGIRARLNATDNSKT